MHRTTTLTQLAVRHAALRPNSVLHGQRHTTIIRLGPSIRSMDYGEASSTSQDGWSCSLYGGVRRSRCDLTLRTYSSNVDGGVDVVAENSKYISSDELNKQIIALSKSGEITKAAQLLQQSQSRALTENNSEILPNLESYTAYLTALRDTQQQLLLLHSDKEAVIRIVSLAETSHNLLIQMEDISGVSDVHSSMHLSGVAPNGIRVRSIRPTSLHYDVIMEVFANAVIAAHEMNYMTTFTMNAPYMAQRWLRRMETLASDVNNSGVKPTNDSYYNVMKACSVIAMMNNNKSSKAPVLTQTIFDTLKENPDLTPTVREYRLLLQTWSSSLCVDGAYKATGVWMSMQRGFRDGDESMEPTLEDGKMVLKAWSRAVNKRAALRAKSVLSEMEKLYTQKKTAVQPDLDCYRHVLAAMSKSKLVTDIGSTIPKLFTTMEDNHIFPDTECFDLAIEALTNCTLCSEDDETALDYSKMAERMFVQMEKESERSSVSVVKPNAKSYTNVIQALAARHTKHAAEKAAALLKRMEAEYARGDESMRPTRDSYVGVINAFGTCGSRKSFIKSNEVLQRMIAQHSNGNEAARPDACSYHAVIRACAKVPNCENTIPEGREKEALVLAISAVQDMKTSNYVHPNAKTYLLLLQCCINLLPEGTTEREKALCSVFRSCAKDGLVSQQILREFQSTVSAEVYHREVVAGSSYYEDVRIIPEKWTRNLGYRVRVKGALDGGSGKRSPIISVAGAVVSTTAYNDYRMRRRWLKKGQMMLRGGRV